MAEITSITKENTISGDSIILAQDAVEKIDYILNDLVTEYTFSAGFVPCFDNLEQYHNLVKGGAMFYNDKMVDNFQKWICHHNSIMLRLSMIEDYMEKLREGLDDADSIITDFNTGKGCEK